MPLLSHNRNRIEANESIMNEVLTPYLIRLAYEQGIFPMASDSGEIEWFQPYRRALFPMSGIRLSKSLTKVIRQGVFDVRFNTAFEQVMRGCARPEGTWINEEIIQVFCEINHQGWGHSGEVWIGNELVGGIYGIAIGSCFCAESMFSRVPNASKVALWAMVKRCCECGFTMFDAQILSPHLESLGAYEIDHEEYMGLIQSALHNNPKFD